MLAVLEGLPYETIAEHTGVSVGTVKSRISRARDTLERLLLEGETRRPVDEGRTAVADPRRTTLRLPRSLGVFFRTLPVECDNSHGWFQGESWMGQTGSRGVGFRLRGACHGR